ncbi:Gfo/Idh/MocA family oxidoreductase [Candidatus Dependentiae bacterium]|nr:Gfo/Idh/MocA family oxidoreductase [Candidatus Dependentiae bacterium]
MKKNFAIIGVGGYIAPRHLQAIKDTGNNLIAALDKNDSVGILDKYFYDVDFFTEFERFDRHIEKLLLAGNKIDYVTICSPNYLHDAHIRFALRIGADAICEKPLVLNPWNLDALQQIEKQTGKKIYCILQLRCHPALIELKKKIETSNKKNKYDINLKYITSRGKWYQFSWKGNLEKSGGLTTNIGIHFFDILIWIFGDVKKQEVCYSDEKKSEGYIELENANVKWCLSIDKNDLPENCGKPTFRSLKIDGEEIEFSEGFTELHTTVYKEIMNGKGFGIEECRKSIELAYLIRNSKKNI